MVANTEVTEVNCQNRIRDGARGAEKAEKGLEVCLR